LRERRGLLSLEVLGFDDSEGSLDRIGRWLNNSRRAILALYFESRLKSRLHWLWTALRELYFLKLGFINFEPRAETFER